MRISENLFRINWVPWAILPLAHWYLANFCLKNHSVFLHFYLVLFFGSHATLLNILS